MAAELALPHRLQKGPFAEKEISTEELQDRMNSYAGKTPLKILIIKMYRN
jgi:hypothetical protein